jgi:hypothetical protein
MKTPQQVFEPLLKTFCQATQDIDISDNFSSIFLPHTMKGYDAAEKKIFYFGRDTSTWLRTGFLMNCYRTDNLDTYIEKTFEWVNKFDFLEYNKKKSSGFWSIAMLLHLKIKGVTEKPSISENLDEKFYDLLNDFGYGNTNAIEVPESLQIQGVWDGLDQNKYWQIKEHSRMFDKLKFTIEAYEPNLVFIFNWKCDEKKFLEGLEFDIKSVQLIKDNFLDIHLTNYDTRIIWTVHPTYGRWLGYTSEAMANDIFDYLQGSEPALLRDLTAKIY